jgi:type I restriction enzyme M protein
MARGKNGEKQTAKSGANLGFEQTLWQAADKLRGNMDASDYKHIVLGLIFLKYISDAFEERHSVLKSEPHANPEDRDEYAAENVFWVPKAARWPKLQAAAKQPGIGKLLDEARLTIEKENQKVLEILSA